MTKNGRTQVTGLRAYLTAGAVLVAMAAGGFATVALAGDGDGKPAAPAAPEGKDGRHAGRRGGFRGRMREAIQKRRERAAEFLTSLQATDAQRQLVLDKAKAAAPIVASARDEARKIIATAWAAATKDTTDRTKIDRKALRETLKPQLMALREKVRGQLEPLAREVVNSLTPEQRAKFQEAASKHGKTVDDAKLVKFATVLISRPMTAAYLEARQAK